MEKLIFNCEVITPMFLAGADGVTPELRPASIKGALRFWWRALNGELNLDKLKEREGDIFGDTKRRSSILIKIDRTLHKVSKDFLLPHKVDKFRSEVGCFPVSDETFNVTLSIVNNKSGLSLNQIKSLFMLTCVLGGFGKRSRRGSGSVNIKTYDTINKIKTAENNENIITNSFDVSPIVSIESIFNMIEEIKKDKYKIEKEAIVLKNPLEYKTEFPYIKEIIIGKNSIEIKQIGLATHDVMKSNPDGYKTSVGAGKPRLASPIYISILKNQHPVITTLNLVSQGNKNYSLQNTLKNKLL